MEISYADDVAIAVCEEARELGQARHERRAECSCMNCGMETHADECGEDGSRGVDAMGPRM